MIGIYKIENTVNGKVYIGQSVDIKKRWKAHRSELCNNTHDNIYLQADWNEYGEGAFTFEVIKKCRSIKLNEWERHYISFYEACDRSKGYNRTRGNGNTLIDKRTLREAKKRTHNYIIILSNDKINDMCVSCGYSCKQSAQNEIIMCKGIVETQ